MPRARYPGSMKLPSLRKQYVGTMMWESDHGINPARCDNNTMESLGAILALGEGGSLVKCTMTIPGKSSIICGGENKSVVEREVWPMTTDMMSLSVKQMVESHVHLFCLVSFSHGEARPASL